MIACPDDETLALFAFGPMPDASRAHVKQHVDGCAQCREIVRHLQPSQVTTAAEAIDDAPFAIGKTIDRYAVERELGRGAMGVVLLARDPELHRRVALKILRPGRRGEYEVRLLREARSMARVAHPNVVTVYDVGVVEGRVFVAMEYVRGTTLRGWLAARPRNVREILAMFDHVGRGLAAAHAAGIVHRDFKPDNVLVGDDGRPRVGDFGLAHAGANGPMSGPISASQVLTREGAVMGTPAYMAPEQRAGERASPQTDQFAFAVALWEALHGSRPRTNQPAARRADVPDEVYAALARAMADRPEHRFATMDHFLAALAPRKTSVVVPLLAIGGALLALGGAVAVGSLVMHKSSPAPAAPTASSDKSALTPRWDDYQLGFLEMSKATISFGLSGFSYDVDFRGFPEESSLTIDGRTMPLGSFHTEHIDVTDALADVSPSSAVDAYEVDPKKSITIQVPHYEPFTFTTPKRKIAYAVREAMTKSVDHPVLFRGESASDPPLRDHTILFAAMTSEVLGPAPKLRDVDWIAVIEKRPPKSAGTCGSTALEAIDENVAIVERKTSHVVGQKLFPAPTSCPKWVSGSTAQTYPNDEDIKRWLREERSR